MNNVAGQSNIAREREKGQNTVSPQAIDLS